MVLIITSILIGILTIILTAIASSGPIKDPLTKEFTYEGKIYIAISCVIVILMPIQILLQNSETKAEALLNKQEQKKEQDSREAVLISKFTSSTLTMQKNSDLNNKNMKNSYDTTIIQMKGIYDVSNDKMKHSYDTSSRQLTSILTNTLGKYGDSLDLTKKELKKAFDSAKTRSVAADDPVLYVPDVIPADNTKRGINFEKHNKGNSIFSVNLWSADAGSSYFDLKMSVVVIDTTIMEHACYIGILPLLSYETKIPKEGGLGQNFFVPDSLKYNFIYLYIRGSYKNLDGSKTIPIDEVYLNNRLGNTVRTMGTVTKENLKLFISQNER